MKYLLKCTIKLSLVLSFLFFGYGLQAQIGLGASVGANINQLNSPGVYTGFNGGLFASYDILFLNARAGVSYNQLGGSRPSYTDAPAGFDFSTEYINRQLVFHNVEIPIYVNVYYPGSEEAAIKPRLTVGFAYGFNVATIEKRDYRLVNRSTGAYAVYSGDKENVRGDFVNHHFDIAGGFGFDFALEDDRKGFVEIMYRQGLNQMNNVGLGRIGNVGDVYTNSIMLNFGMTIFNL
ncbi:hypothetical protein SAMN05661096_03465 [Marivirga sericea]|uniref:Outer membrane protein beta-barrel domain-containing protein n=1 Tax=Marivirga sericea TaxID=1028 RepID=A0A1X7L403_9BACT|nr:hypothetical protein [Marivirga sericea]SMG48435.1 hypothetical protein SAMN05661096_03465 [Marivirga sericea]